MKRTSVIFTIGLLLSGIVHAADFPREMNALAVFNAFIARYASEDISWRTDVRLRMDDTVAVPAGFAIGRATIGEFIYRPKLFTELTLDEKRKMSRDPRLPAFIESLRVAADWSHDDTSAQNTDTSVKVIGNVEYEAQPLDELRDGLAGSTRRASDIIKTVNVDGAAILSDGPVRIYIP